MQLWLEYNQQAAIVFDSKLVIAFDCVLDFGTCMEQPAIICKECTIADDIPLRRRLLFWSSLDDS